MPDKEKVIKGLECCTSEQACKGCPYNQNENGHVCTFNCFHDALALLGNEEERYADMVLSWLMEIALNNSDAREEMLYIDAVEDIRDRARHGLKQYFIDKQKGQC